MEKKLIWDMPTRLFHWLLVASIVAQYFTAEVLDNAIQWHFYIGYFTLGLILFRVIWGFVGTTYAKFSQFVHGPKATLNYAKTLTNKNSTPHAGHNPMGAWMVLALLSLIALQAVSGLFISDDIFSDGPYFSAVSESTQSTMSFIHHNVFNVIIIAVALHIAAIVFYAVFKKQRLVPAMVHGKKATTAPGISSSKLLVALVVALLVAGVVYYVVEVAPPEAAEEELYF